MNKIIMDSTIKSIEYQTSSLTVNEPTLKINDFIIRHARLEDLAQMCDWRTRELGYISHIKLFKTILIHYSEGFFVAEGPDGSIIGSILGINFDDTTAFGLLYAVRPNYRCRGIGSKLWDLRLNYILPRNLAINADSTRIDANKRVDLAPAFKLTGFSGKLSSMLLAKVKMEVKMKLGIFKIINLATYLDREKIIAALLSYDSFIHTIPRTKFIKALIDTNEIVTCVAIEEYQSETNLKICKILGLYANEPEIARALFLNLVATIEESDKDLTIIVVNEDFNSELKLSYISDSPQANRERREMVEKFIEDLDFVHKLNLCRMYSKNKVAPKLPLSKVYAFTCVECFLT